MPELPEVETVKRGLEPHIDGQKILSCVVHCQALRFPFDPDFENRLSGRIVKNIRRRGKYMVVVLDDDLSVIWHLGMSGSVKIIPAGDAYSLIKHDHVVLSLQNGVRIIYHDPRRFGFMVLCPASDWQSHKFFAGMGPEPLDNMFDGAVLHQALTHKKCDIKAALLDQRVVAGIGNIYACEALYMAGISPRRKCHTLSKAKCEKLAASIRTVLADAIAAGGSTLRDYRHTDGSLGYFQHRFTVYDRAGSVCPSCRAENKETPCVKRIVQSGRSTFYCTARQK